jgi:hypothetical protein
MGTDNGMPIDFHKDALWRELKVFVDHGMSAQQAIIDAPRTNTRVVGIPTWAPSNQANLRMSSP